MGKLPLINALTLSLKINKLLVITPLWILSKENTFQEYFERGLVFIKDAK